MHTKQLLPVLLALGLGGALSAAGQTGRIAHFSHGGSVATLGAEESAADNFGEPATYFIADTIRYLSPRTALGYGRWSWGHRGNTDTMRLPTAMSKPAAARYWHQLFVKAQLIGFDSISGPARMPPVHLKRTKRAALVPVLPTGPAGGPGWGLVLGLLLGLGGAGWVLAGKPQPMLGKVA